MNSKPLSQAQDKDVRHVEQALERAARRTREIAVQTRTALVVVRDGRLVREHPIQTGAKEDVPWPCKEL
ncbi:MAG: hypothetical protein HQL75_16715 [Magnetococcales bacterium]|nr:hypothetical protein [Magnetococcales bacterium]